MKKIYILLITICLGGIVNGQVWQSLGPSEFNQASFCDVEYTSIVINGNGVPIIAFRDYCTGNLNVKKFYGNNWLNIGNIDTSKTVYEPSMVIDSSGTLYVAYGNSTNGKVNVIKFNGNNWVNVGSPDFSSGLAQYISLTLDGNGLPYIVYSDYSNMKKATVMKFNGINWINVGSPGFTSGQANYTSIDIDNNGNPYIVYSDYGYSKKATVMKYNGTNWVYVGSPGFSVAQASFASISITNTGTPYIVYSDYGNSQKATVMKYNGNSWVNVGSSGFSAGGASHTSIVFDTNGTPYVVYYDIGNGFKAIVKRYNGNIWETVGSSYISIGQVKYPSIAFDGSGFPFIVYSDYSNGVKATLKKFNGSSWIDIGNTPGLSTSSAADIKISVNQIETPHVVYTDHSTGGKASVMKFDGSNWVYLGSPGFSAGASSYKSIAFDGNNTPYVAYKDEYNSGKATVMKFNGNNWVYLGNPGFSTGSILDLNLALDKNGIPYVVYRDLATNYNQATVMKYNGSNWVNVGTSGFSADQAYHTSIALDSIGTPYVAYSDYANNYKAVVKKFNGNSWVDVGNYGISAGSASYTSIKIDKNGNPYVLFQDGANGSKVTVMKYNGSNWINLGNPGFTNDIANYISMEIDDSCIPYVVYSDNSVGKKACVMKYNGNNWVNVGISGFSAGPLYSLSIALGSNGTPYVALTNGSAWAYKLNMNNCINPINGGGISSNQNICIGTTPATLSNIVSPIGYIGNLDYKWQKSTISSNLGFIDIQSSNLASYNPGNITQTTWFKRLSKVSCDTLWPITGESNVILINVINLPPTADSINGLSSVCQGQNSITYTTPAIANATSYVWTLPAGVTGTSATNSIIVNYGNYAVSGNITVKGINACGAGIPSSLFVNVNPLPSSSGLISGSTNVCKGQTNVFSVSPIANANSYIWTLPTGVTGTSDSNSINVYIGLTASNGNITVKGINSCGIGATSAISIYVNPTPSAAGNITGQTNVCQGQNSIIYNVPPIPNASFYEWTLPTGVIGLSSIDTIYVDYSNTANSGHITVKGVNSVCYGDSSSLQITVNSLPSIASLITGTTNVTAAQQNVQYSIPAIANATSYVWTLPNGASGTSTTNTITVNYSSSAVSGNIIVKGVNSCGIGDSSSLYITVNPFNPNCSAQFDLVADTAVLHHYFVVNNASGVPPLQYNWIWGDGAFSTTAYPTHTYNVSGNYKICLTIIDSVGCITTYCDSSYLQKDPNAIISVQVIPQGTLGISNLLSDKIKIYPNPVKDNLIIELIESNISQRTTISIYNIQGQLCRQIISNQPKNEIDIKDLSTGLYVVKVNNEKDSFVSRFVKE